MSGRLDGGIKISLTESEGSEEVSLRMLYLNYLILYLNWSTTEKEEGGWKGC